VAGPVTNDVFQGDPADGYVSAAGFIVAGGSGVYVGDNALDDYSAGFLRFVHASVPAGASVVSATLYAYQSVAIGTPFTQLGAAVLVDHVNIDLGAGAGLDPLDLGSAAYAVGIGSLSSSMALGFRFLDVTAAVQADLDAGRSTSDFRLYFASGTDGAGDADYVLFDDAEAGGPALLITWR
jgi:hypothetical protein